jgi:Ca2+-transporting ATPase
VHCLGADEALARLGVAAERGLGAAGRRAARPLRSERDPRARAPQPAADARRQFTDFMIVVLMVAAAISALIGEPEDSIVILVIVVLNAIVGFVQEYRAERAMAALKQLAAAAARVVRDGSVAEIAAPGLVPGDIVLLEAGNVVPADMRLLESAPLRVEEAALTGESVPVDKRTTPLADADAALGDRRNMAYKGTTVVYGRGRGVVVGTGMQTELGRIATLLSGDSEGRTPAERLTHFGKRISVVPRPRVAIFALGIARGEPFALMLLTAVSLAVAAIPEALPAVITTALALGAYRMVKKNALIRRLPAVETLGSVTYICSDKTGTLTENRMRVERLVVDGQAQASGRAPQTEAGRLLLAAMALSNDAVASGESGATGDPTEVALFVAAREAGFEKDALAVGMPRVAEVPFDAERQRMTTVHRTDGGFVAFTKGSPERVAERCATMLVGDAVAAIDRDAVLAEAGRMAASGLRVLAIALRRWPDFPAPLTAEAAESELTLLGLAGLMDPPRAEAFEAVALCKSAGIVPVMVTGDHPETARD